MITGTFKISDIVFDNPRILLVLEHLGIKLGFDEKSVDMVCAEYALNKKLFLTFVNLYCCKDEITVDARKFDAKDLETILLFLKNSHIFFLDEKIPKLKKLINRKIKNSPREKYSLMIKKFIDDYSAEVFAHMDQEDKIVFPYVESLLKQNRRNEKYSMKQFKKHHTNIEVKLIDLKNLLIKYVSPDYDSIVRRKILFELFNLERDINIHDHIENHLLIPIAERLENDLG